jgi:hypothetical protein
MVAAVLCLQILMGEYHFDELQINYYFSYSGKYFFLFDSPLIPGRIQTPIDEIYLEEKWR